MRANSVMSTFAHSIPLACSSFPVERSLEAILVDHRPPGLVARNCASPDHTSGRRIKLCHAGRVMKIGVVSDTHGLLRAEVPPLLAGVERILHLGDVGDPKILDRLGEIAPVTAVRGNIDREGPCAHLPETEVLLIEGGYLYLLHDIST